MLVCAPRLAVASVAAGLLAAATASEVGRRFERTFPVHATPRLTAHVGAADVEVVADPEAKETRVQGWAAGADGDVEALLSALPVRGNKLRVNIMLPDDRRSDARVVRWRVTLPPGGQVDVHATTGSTTVRGGARVRVFGGEGPIDLRDAAHAVVRGRGKVVVSRTARLTVRGAPREVVLDAVESAEVRVGDGAVVRGSQLGTLAVSGLAGELHLAEVMSAEAEAVLSRVSLERVSIARVQAPQARVEIRSPGPVLEIHGREVDLRAWPPPGCEWSVESGTPMTFAVPQGAGLTLVLSRGELAARMPVRVRNTAAGARVATLDGSGPTITVGAPRVHLVEGGQAEAPLAEPIEATGPSD